MSAWKPIETAPKDGTVVDLWAAERERYENGRVTDCFYEDGHWYHPATIYDPKEAWAGTEVMPVFNATHWMPLPEPPND